MFYEQTTAESYKGCCRGKLDGSRLKKTYLYSYILIISSATMDLAIFINNVKS